MAEQPPSDQSPQSVKELPNLVEASKLTLGQKTQNFLGFGYGINTAISVAFVNIIRKTCGPLIEKWEDRIARKFAEKSIKRELGEAYNQLSAEDKSKVYEHYLKRGKIYAKKKVEGYLLSFGGFAVLPGQSALENYHHEKNVLTPINTYRSEKKADIEAQEQKGQSVGDQIENWLKSGASGVSNEEARNQIIKNLKKAKGTDKAKDALVEAQLDSQIAAQKEKLDPIKNKAELNLLNKAKEKPEYSLFGDATKKGLPRWIFGRVTALVAAYTTQTVVETIAGDKKDKVDMVLAKIFTKIFHPSGYSPAPESQNIFKELGIEHDAPKDVDPKILSKVRMFTTDGYMTTAALLTHNAMNEALKPLESKWEERQAKKEAANKTSSLAP